MLGPRSLSSFYFCICQGSVSKTESTAVVAAEKKATINIYLVRYGKLEMKKKKKKNKKLNFYRNCKYRKQLLILKVRGEKGSSWGWKWGLILRVWSLGLPGAEFKAAQMLSGGERVRKNAKPRTYD